MTRLSFALLLALGLAACEEGRYPFSQQECAADDPVVLSDTIDCPPLPTGTGTF